jgi:hypothetical protein
MIKNLLLGFAVAFAAGIGFGLLDYFSGSSSSTSVVMPMVLGFLTFLVLQALSGNRKEARVDDATRQSSLSAPAPAGQALLYIYREGFMGKAVGWNVSLDGKALAQLRSPRFTHTTINPGRHTLAVSLGGFAGTQNKPAETSFDAQAGEVIVFAMKTKMSALSNTLSFVREPDTATALQKLSRIPMVAAEPTVPGVAA